MSTENEHEPTADDVVQPFVVAFIPGVTPTKWVRTWKERMPDSPIEPRAMSAADAVRGVRDGSSDVAFLRFVPGGLPIADIDLNAIPLYEEQLVVVAGKEHPLAAFDTVALAELDGEVVLRGDEGAEHGAVLPEDPSLLIAGLQSPLGQDAATVELVAAGSGLALMPQSVARVHSRRDIVARLVTGAPETRVALVWHKDRTTPLVEDFIGIVRGRTSNSSRSGSSGAEDAGDAQQSRSGAKKGATPSTAGAKKAKKQKNQKNQTKAQANAQKNAQEAAKVRAQMGRGAPKAPKGATRRRSR